MQSTKTNRLTLLALTASLLALVACLPMFTFAAGPTGQPTGTNVDANFASIKLPNGPKMTGSYGKFVGLTGTALNGCLNTDSVSACPKTGSYASATNLCQAAFPSYGESVHVCTAQELINTGRYNPEALTGVTGWAWINNGPPGYFSSLSNDCNGWKSNNTDSANWSVYGSKWGFDASAKYAKATSCDQKLKFACCTY